MLEDPWEAPPEDAFRLHLRPGDAPAPTEVVIGFEAGLPVSLDGEELPLAELVARSTAQAGAYGIGRIDMIENRAVGIKSRELYEAPAAIALIAAHRALEDLVLTKAELETKRWVEDALGAARSTTGSGSARCARRSTRSWLRRRSSSPARCGSSCGRSGGRQRPAFGARALRRDARVVRDRGDVPARGGRRLRPGSRRSRPSWLRRERARDRPV